MEDMNNPGVMFVTLGCAKNEVDTDRMRSQLLRAGMHEAFELDAADLVLINTCSFLSAATQEGIEATLDLIDEIEASKRAIPLIMCGCMPSRYGEELSEELPEVTRFVRHDEEDNIVDIVLDALSGTFASETSKAISSAAPGSTTTTSEHAEALRTVERSIAYVKISEGCNRMCSFCAIPLIRGRYYSRQKEEILAEVRALMDGGVKEIILIGQDTGVWGCDLEPQAGQPQENLAQLIKEVACVVRPYKGWLRVLYLQPEGMTDELIATIRDTPEVLPYIDIPIQHCSERVLHRMGRKGSPQSLGELFARLRREIPGICLRTTAMAGFPSETDEEAEELASFIEEQAFDYCSVFAYSAEEGTRAAAMQEQIPDDVKLERTQRLIDTAERCGFAATAAHVGEMYDVIIDGVEETDKSLELIGHTWFQAPDSDGVVHIDEGEACVGDMVRCRITDAFCYELIGQIVDDDTRGDKQ